MDLCLSLDRKRRRGTVPVPVPVFVAQPVVAAFAYTVTGQLLRSLETQTFNVHSSDGIARLHAKPDRATMS